MLSIPYNVIGIFLRIARIENVIAQWNMCVSRKDFPPFLSLDFQFSSGKQGYTIRVSLTVLENPVHHWSL